MFVQADVAAQLRRRQRPGSPAPDVFIVCFESATATARAACCSMVW